MKTFLQHCKFEPAHPKFQEKLGLLKVELIPLRPNFDASMPYHLPHSDYWYRTDYARFLLLPPYTKVEAFRKPVEGTLFQFATPWMLSRITTSFWSDYAKTPIGKTFSVLGFRDSAEAMRFIMHLEGLGDEILGIAEELEDLLKMAGDMTVANTRVSKSILEDN